MSEHSLRVGEGQIRHGFNRGKKIDTWSFQAPFSDEKIEIEILAGTHEKRLIFTARSQEHEINLASENLNDLHSQLLDLLDARDNLRSDAVWENWLEVIVTGGNDHHSGGRHSGPFRGYDTPDQKQEKIILSYAMVRKAIYQGDEYIMNINNNPTPFPKPKEAGVKDEEDKVMFQGKLVSMGSPRLQDSSYSYIPDTPENRKALNEVIMGMNELRNNLSRLLNQDGAQRFLSDVLHRREKALPAPGH